MVSRVTDDYKRMALAGCVLVSEPAFWAGFDRSGAEGFRDYFRQLTEYVGSGRRHTALRTIVGCASMPTRLRMSPSPAR
jgi:predicted metal-dependent TIM-barrel fold hydrolase